MFSSKAKYGTPPLFWTRTILDVRSLAGRQNDIDRTRVPRPRPVQPDGAVWLCGSVWLCVALCGSVWLCVALWRYVALCGAVWMHTIPSVILACVIG